MRFQLDNAEADIERDRTGIGQDRGALLRDRLQVYQYALNSALDASIVLVRLRIAEIHEHAIAHVLGHEAVEAA
jgi:hypothetical protein